MGAILLLSADLRIGAKGDFKIGLNEVAIGMSLPVFGVEFARERLSKRDLERATGQSEIYEPKGARKAGFLDRVTKPESVVAEALARTPRRVESPGAQHHQAEGARGRDCSDPEVPRRRLVTTRQHRLRHDPGIGGNSASAPEDPPGA
jgi:enoyl-CoA hydratase